MKTYIRASDVTIREMSGRKCDKIYSGQCPIQKGSISRDMIDLPYFDSDGYYIPEDFCKGLAAKYLFSESDRQKLFTGFKCVKHKCGHIRMHSGMNHRMCVLGHLDEIVEVELEEYDGPCIDCEISQGL